MELFGAIILLVIFVVSCCQEVRMPSLIVLIASGAGFIYLFASTLKQIGAS